MAKSKSSGDKPELKESGGLLPPDEELSAPIEFDDVDEPASPKDTLDDFEDTFSRLKAIVSELEREDIKLGEMVGLFEEGVSLIKKCDGFLRDARGRVEKYIERDADGKWVIKGLEKAE